MNGIYIHIPFCKKVCYYCDFHFSVSLKLKDRLLDCLAKEIEMRKDYFHSPNVDTIYFGGGTPSVLTPQEIERLLDCIHRHFNVSANAEITLEANPDDLTTDYLQSIKKLGINRLSIGIQSFFDDDLKWMNRRHTAQEAERCIKLAQDTGLTNMNIDLIYGLPQLSAERWAQNLEKFFLFNIPHLSAYHLTIEPKTVLGHYKKKGKLNEIGEEESLLQYSMLIDKMKRNGYEHYEISNFCKDGMFSRHNTNYWQGGKYLGAGPSAHSYDGTARRWNLSVNQQYIEAIEQGKIYFEDEQLGVNERFNDYLLTGLRTIWGVDLRIVRESFGEKYLRHIQQELSKFANTGYMILEEEHLRLSDNGMFVSDRIISDLFYVE
ncbi:MAG: radical SAM family heme chaperone HemW [Bacteroidota bacterium]|nr:radical SAM family heme chaperone HemW [Bacteroidota bacterium]